SDILGNHSLLFSLAINGRISEAQALAAYINQAHRLNWVLGASQYPVYFYLPTTVEANPADPSGNTFIVTPRLARYVIRDAFAQTFYPFDRFTRLEFGSHISNMTQGVQQQQYLTDAFGNVIGVSHPVTIQRQSASTCPELDQLSGSRIAVANAELRFPLTRSLILGFLPVGLPPIEGAIFYDAGIAWYSNSIIKWDRSPLWAGVAQSAILR